MAEAMNDPLPTPEPEPTPSREFGAGPPSAFAPPTRWRRRFQIAGWAVAAGLALLMVIIAWLAVTAPLSRSLKPIAPPSISLMSADSHLIARRGAIIDRPVAVADLPKHVPQAFMAIEDRRFYSHWGVDPRGIVRAA
jgi:penicillin-binding protein 1A